MTPNKFKKLLPLLDVFFIVPWDLVVSVAIALNLCKKM